MERTASSDSAFAEAMWHDATPLHDSYLGFRGSISASVPGRLAVRVICPCPFLLYLDGKWVGEGPVRWPKSAPTYQVFEFDVAAEPHLVCISAHREDVDTRMMEFMPPFLGIDASMDGRQVSIDWKSQRLGGHASEVRRINPQFGWMEWSEASSDFPGWTLAAFDDRYWGAVKRFPLPVAQPKPTDTKILFPTPMPLRSTKQGVFTEDFGYQADDPPARFFLRDLQAHHGAPQGVWRRYDLGKVRLGRMSVKLDLPAGAVVEIAHSESLAGVEKRVNPWITLSGGPSCNMDHFGAGGEATFMGHTPKGGRYVEVHVLADPKQVHFIEEQFFERTYFSKPAGHFQSSDHRLDRIWEVGVETLRTCTEDSVIDNPTRERGEWIGDSLTVGLENGAAAFGDLTLFRQAMRHAAQSARGDGLVAGLCPGTVSYLSTYACHWVVANIRHWELTGDKDFLHEMLPAAERNMAAFAKCLGPTGLTGDLGWAFIDWGYVGNGGPSDMGLNLIYAGALQAMVRWCKAFGTDAEAHATNLDRVLGPIKAYLLDRLDKPDGWKTIGLQRTVLALRLGLLSDTLAKSGVQFIKRHYLSCFPNDPMAPNLADPGTAQPRLITPFFSHFALPVLWEHGQGDFALDQYRSCWGWALDQGLTTWPEVFDLRWSHCHQWSGCPTWQLSRYVLGLWPRQDLGPNTFEFKPQNCSLESAKGVVPVPGTDRSVAVLYELANGKRKWQFEAPFAMRLQIGNEMKEFTGRFEHSVGASG